MDGRFLTPSALSQWAVVAFVTNPQDLARCQDLADVQQASSLNKFQEETHNRLNRNFACLNVMAFNEAWREDLIIVVAKQLLLWVDCYDEEDKGYN